MGRAVWLSWRMAQINTITPRFVENHSLDVRPLSDLIGRWGTCIGLVNALTQPIGYVIIWVHIDRVQCYDEDQIALVILDLSSFVMLIPMILETPTIGYIVNMIKEKEIDTLAMPWVNTQVAYLLAVQWVITTSRVFRHQSWPQERGRRSCSRS